jgi:hypothetical protein
VGGEAVSAHFSQSIEGLRRDDGKRSHDMTTPEENRKSWHDSLPFPKRWLGYIALKIVVLALAIFLALRWNGLL